MKQPSIPQVFIPHLLFICNRRRSALLWEKQGPVLSGGPQAKRSYQPPTERLPGWRLPKSDHQQVPRTTHRRAKPNSCREQNVSLASFDPLKRPQVQIGLFCKLLLSQSTRHSLASEIGTERTQLANEFLLRGHGVLCRKSLLRSTAHHAVND